MRTLKGCEEVAHEQSTFGVCSGLVSEELRNETPFTRAEGGTVILHKQ